MVRVLPDDEENPETYDLSFTINDGTDPIEGATVTIGAKTGTTGSAGGCTVTGVEAGTDISVTVAKEGYVSKTETITVDETHTSFTISLTAIVAEVNILVMNGESAYNAGSVTLSASGFTSVTENVDSVASIAAFTNIPVGEYTATVVNDTETVLETTVSVVAGTSNYTLNINP